MRYKDAAARAEGKRLKSQQWKAAHREEINKKERERYQAIHAVRIAEKTAEDLDHDTLLAQGLKRCTLCELPKDIEDFRLHPLGRDGRDSRCQSCRNGKKREKWRKDIESSREKSREENHRRAARQAKAPLLDLPTEGADPLSWAAGFIDAEGSIGSVRRNEEYILVRLMAHNSSVLGLIALQKMFGGSVNPTKSKNPRHKDMNRWELNGKKAYNSITKLFPFLVGKKPHARLAIKAYRQQSIAADMKLTKLNRRGLWMKVKIPRVPSPICPSADDVAYLAGLLDGDGTISASFSEKSMGIVVIFGNSNVRIIEWVRDRFGGGISPGQQRKEHHRPVIPVSWSGRRAKHLVQGVLPFLKEKRRQAEIVLELSTLKRHYDPRASDGKRVPTIRPETLARRQVLISELRQLNQRGIPEV